MNVLFRNKYLLNGYQSFKSHNTIQLIPKQLNAFQRVVNRKYSYSTGLILFSQFGPLAAIIFGRIIQKDWPQLRYFNQRVLIDFIRNYKWKVLPALGLIGGTFITITYKFREETPFTKRQRFVVLNKQNVEDISEMIYKLIIESNKNQILSSDHIISKRVNRIVNRLLVANKHLTDISDKNWSVYVIRASNVANAFALPTGQIFVYTGLIEVCNNDDQIATILAHELSHTLLIHGNEVISREVCNDLIHSFVVMLLWIRLKAIRALIWTLITRFASECLLISPKRRLIETEADFVGLTLAARACYDVREGSAFWMKMFAFEERNKKDNNNNNNLFGNIYKWFNPFSTHPPNELRYELMDSYMNSMIRLMECYNCPKLSKIDPRHSIKRRILDSNIFRND